jgi:hypothetical protein
MFRWKNRFAFFEIGNRRFGFEMSRVEHGGVPYLDRYILYIGGPALRLHKFWRGDDDRAPHDHPWGFSTFPLSSYWERAFFADGTDYVNLVKKFTWNWRPAEYRHIVMGRADFGPRGCTIGGVSREPFWTFVVSTGYQRKWGFWPEAGKFVPWRDWPSTAEQIDIRKQRSHS